MNRTSAAGVVKPAELERLVRSRPPNWRRCEKTTPTGISGRQHCTRTFDPTIPYNARRRGDPTFKEILRRPAYAATMN
jgi:hypothetical protein